MAREVKFFSRDLYSLRHRDHDGIASCDIDSVEICKNYPCYSPLAIIETVYDTGYNYNKMTYVVENIANGLNIPAFLVFYQKGLGNSLFYKIRQIAPFKSRLRSVSEYVWVSYLRKLQRQHQPYCKHGKR